MEETCEASYLAGCDGARSTVREVLATGFPGGTYSDIFYVADVEGLARRRTEKSTSISAGPTFWLSFP